jgi:hypothetical protein
LILLHAISTTVKRANEFRRFLVVEAIRRTIRDRNIYSEHLRAVSETREPIPAVLRQENVVEIYDFGVKIVRTSHGVLQVDPLVGEMIWKVPLFKTLRRAIVERLLSHSFGHGCCTGCNMLEKWGRSIQEGSNCRRNVRTKDVIPRKTMKAQRTSVY